MNPHDPLKKPGAHLVHERLGVDNPWELHRRHPDDRALARLGFAVATAARDFDTLHTELVAKAQQVIERLDPIARGDHASMLGINGILQSAGLKVEMLTARRGAAYQQLTGALTAYELCTDASGLPSAEPALTRGQAERHTRAPGAPDLLNVSSRYGRHLLEFNALVAIDRGDLRLCESPTGGYTYLSGLREEGPAVWVDTVEELIDEGLVAADASTSSYRPGHLLSLTESGQALLDAARADDRRVLAARSRTAGPSTPPAVGPDTAAPIAASRPSRSR
ncbi:hypothetical protein ABTX81_05790 [Kitasatospora sp. NPDC097605]|uniref:hypothetical protein n=1 Tax=Kitasatospora sp. NPDC097605 TaxID=3157226 RepID=UPI00332A49A5